MTHSSTQILSVPYSVKMKWLILRNKNFHNLADMPNIDVIDGQAEFINNHSLRVHRPEGNLEIHGEKIFINTGAQTVVPPIPGITTTPGI